MRCSGHVARCEKRGHPYEVLVEDREGKRTQLSHKREDNIKMDLKVMACEGCKLDLSCWQALANMVMNFWVQ